jgi:hypothetical protein
LKRLVLALLLLLPAGAWAQPQLGGPVSPDGKAAVQVDLPVDQRTKNVGGRNGAGLCVFTSIGHAARWQNEDRLVNFQRDMRKELGGGWPEKVDQMIAKYGKGADYLQYQGNDPAVLIAALKGGRMPSVTYNGHDPNYGNRSVAHMVNLVAYTGDTASDWVCVLDNNFIAADKLVWMRPAEFKQRWCGQGGGWAVVLLANAPPPIPVNALSGRPGQKGERYSPPTYAWRYYPQHPWGLWLETPSGLTVGAWYWKERHFRWYDRAMMARLEPVPDAPYPVPPRPSGGRYRTVSTVVDHGVNLAMFPRRAPGEEIVTRKGRAIRLAEALRQLGQCPGPGPCPLRPKKPSPSPKPGPAPKKPLPDDAGLLRLTVSGPQALLDAVKKDLDAAPELAPWKGKLVTQFYDPAHWHLTSVGLPAGLVLQAPPGPDGKGKVLHRQADYSGPADLARALRKADPSYDPSRDPDRRRPDPAPQPAPAPAAAPLGAAGLLVPLGLIALALVPVFVARFKKGGPPWPLS